jgi:hypothetical protein
MWFICDYSKHIVERIIYCNHEYNGVTVTSWMYATGPVFTEQSVVIVGDLNVDRLRGEHFERSGERQQLALYDKGTNDNYCTLSNALGFNIH